MSEIKVRENRVLSQISDLEKELKESSLHEKTRLKEREADMEKMYKLRITLEQIVDQIKTKTGVISEEGKCLKDLENKVRNFLIWNLYGLLPVIRAIIRFDCTKYNTCTFL